MTFLCHLTGLKRDAGAFKAFTEHRQVDKSENRRAISRSEKRGTRSGDRQTGKTGLRQES